MKWIEVLFCLVAALSSPWEGKSKPHPVTHRQTRFEGVFRGMGHGQGIDSRILPQPTFSVLPSATDGVSGGCR